MTLAPEKLGSQVVDTQRDVSFEFLTSLLLVRRGWFANQVMHLTRRWPSG